MPVIFQWETYLTPEEAKAEYIHYLETEWVEKFMKDWRAMRAKKEQELTAIS